MEGSAAPCYSYWLMTTAERLGRNIKALLDAKGITQTQFALSLDFKQGSISQLLSAKRGTSLSTLDKIAEVLKVDVSVLFQSTPADTAQIQPIVAPQISSTGRTDTDSPEATSGYTAAGPQVPHGVPSGPVSAPEPPEDHRLVIANALSSAATKLYADINRTSQAVPRTRKKVAHFKRRRKGRRVASR